MTDILHWLSDQKEYPKFFFRDRDTGKNLAAAGAKDILEKIPANPQTLYVGACRFSGSGLFFAPKHIHEDNGTIAPKNLPISFESRKDLPSKKSWVELVEQALSRIQEKCFDKVVLARQTTLHLRRPVDPYSLLRYLCNNTKRAACFLLETAPDHAFVGATPEKLYTREGKKIIVDALAGTTPLGEKERREFEFVKKFIEESLAPYCETFNWEEDRVLETTRMQHFFNRFLATLRKCVSDADLVALLHPTPAMAGLPQKEALEHLKKHEPFERGWYASPLGWISPDSANIAVGIRSALITPSELQLFAGAGIVEGSDPEKEWNELELKISQYVKA